MDRRDVWAIAVTDSDGFQLFDRVAVEPATAVPRWGQIRPTQPAHRRLTGGDASPGPDLQACPGHGHSHDQGGHLHDHGGTPRTVVLEQRVLAHNDRLAEGNRDWLNGRGILAVNLTSSPGSGKTTLIERTIRDLGSELGLSVV